MVIEAAVVTMFQASGVVIVSSIVEKGLEMSGKESLAKVVKVLTLVGVGYFVCLNLIDFMNFAGRLFL